VDDVKENVTREEYWIEISQAGVRLGAGFFLTRCHVLTAFHCLRGAVPGNDEVDISFSAGATLSGRIYRRSPKADLALIDIPDPGNWPTLPNPDQAHVGETWHNPYRPSNTHAYLSGHVAATPVAYECEGGETIEAIQLGCLQPLGDYAGYSGSPIEHSGQDDGRVLLGILLEQYPEQYSDLLAPKRATTVLFAATIAEVFRRFDCFDVNNLLKLLMSPSHEVTKESSPNNVPAQDWADKAVTPLGRARQIAGPIESTIDAAHSILVSLREWESCGLLEGLDVSTLRSGVLQKLIGNVMGDDT
jgi:Trypsin-like peptidase domain